MLAYVFWHWPQPNIARGSYLDHLADFHRTLTVNKPAGFQRSVVFGINGANWLNTAGEAFEEWYVVDDSAALDRLNEAAVSGACEQPHNLVAREAAGGTAGLYRFRAGDAELSQARFAVWFNKPDGISYSALYSTLEPLTSQTGAGLWGRQMILGPATEFCLHSPSPLRLPENYAGLTLPLELIWS